MTVQASGHPADILLRKASQQPPASQMPDMDDTILQLEFAREHANDLFVPIIGSHPIRQPSNYPTHNLCKYVSACELDQIFRGNTQAIERDMSHLFGRRTLSSTVARHRCNCSFTHLGCVPDRKVLQVSVHTYVSS